MTALAPEPSARHPDKKPLIEAQSFGAVPVLFDTYPIARWIVESGVNGVLIPPFDTDRMAEQTVALATSPELPAFMRRSLQNAERFQVDKVGDMWFELFDRLA